MNDKLEVINRALGLNKEEPILIELKKTDDENIKELHLKSGSFDSNEPWFVTDSEDENKAYAVLPMEAFNQLVKTMKEIQQENFNLKLEKSILQYMPTDFEDVWVVAMDRIENLIDKENPNKPISIDIDKLVRDIKEEHPNLFINMKNFFPPFLK
jgi:hypothetical protein